ncbi:MAG: hypothetical protein JNK88_12200, partial [Mangrovicoccus sp.]|nr:hypothetical protein [Mangrovicoccus sp.]
EEILDFALALVEITLLTLAIGFYPVDMLSQRGKVDLSFLRTLFLYALIGCQTALKRNPLSASKRDPLQR